MSEEIDQQDQITPGEAINKARQASKLSLDEIAELLNVTPAKIEALEKDDYDQLASPIFVRGYLRNCARILDLSGDELVALYDRQTGQVSPAAKDEGGDSAVVPMSTRPVDSPAMQSSNTFMKPILIAAALLILALVLVFMGEDEAVSDSATAQALTSSSEPSSGEGSSADVILVSDRSPVVDETSSVEAGESESTILTTSAADGSVNPAEEVDALAGNDLTSDDSFPVDQEAAPTVAQPLVVQPSVIQEVETSNAKTLDMLSIRFSQECWLEVRDSNNRVVYSGVANAGDVLAREGLAPFTVRLGNAGAAELFINEQPVNFSVPQGRKTLRLTIAEDASLI